MKNLNILLILLAITFFNCSTEEKKPTMTPEEEKKAWSQFQNDFQTAVRKNAIKDVVNLTHFPVKTNLSLGNSDGISKANLIKNYKAIFGSGVRDRIVKAQRSEWSEAIVDNKQSAQIIGVPHKSKVVTLTLNFVFDEGKENQTESSTTFYFGKVNEEFKWIGLFGAG